MNTEIITKNILLVLFFAVGVIFLLNYRKSMEPFVNNDLTQSKVDELLGNLKIEMEKLEQSYNKPEIKNKEFPEYINGLSKKFEELNKNMKGISASEEAETIRKITKLQREIDYLNKQTEKLKDITEPGTIKSLQNGMNLSIIGTDNGNYLIAVNDGFLKVYANNTYDVVKMNGLDKSQQFNIIRIYDKTGYNKELHPIDKVRDNDNIKYPFAIIKSINTGSCLKNNFGSLSVEPLSVNKGQRWKLLDTNIKCN